MKTFDLIVMMVIEFSAFFLVPAGILFGIIFALKSAAVTGTTGDTSAQSITHVQKKKKYTKIMWWSFATPLVIIFFTLILFGFVETLSAAFK